MVKLICIYLKVILIVPKLSLTVVTLIYIYLNALMLQLKC